MFSCFVVWKDRGKVLMKLCSLTMLIVTFTVYSKTIHDFPSLMIKTQVLVIRFVYVHVCETVSICIYTICIYTCMCVCMYVCHGEYKRTAKNLYKKAVYYHAFFNKSLAYYFPLCDQTSFLL